MKRYVTKTDKDEDGDITALCNDAASWSPRKKKDAIEDIKSGTHSYWVDWPDVPETRIRVIKRQNGTKYLRTDRDNTTRNNLNDLPDC